MSAAQRPRLRSAALVAVLVAAPLLAAAQAGKPAPVKEPYWGAILFDYYQERYFTAITGLMASQHFDRVPLHADEAEILRGGLLLSYGLHEEAGRIFAALIDKGAAPSVRDRAWYFLAKIRYQRGLPQQAEAALDRVQGQLPAEVEDDRGLLAAQLMMARSDFAGAAAMLQALPRTSGGTPYALYNLGVALIKSGDTTGGARVLNQLGTTPAPTEEIRSLRDKTNVALGFAALQDQRADDARAALARVRLNGLHSNKALLGFGWAAAAKKDTRQALVSWSELAGRDIGDSAVLEARIAVPYALAELGALGSSLEGYQLAIDTFARESAALDDSIGAIRAGKFVQALVDKNAPDQMGWFWNLDQLPVLPHAGHISQLLATHEMQEALKNLRDLQFLARNLQDWADNLGVYGDMLQHRAKGYADTLPQVRARAGELPLAAMQRQRDALAAEFARAEREQDATAFANARERELIARLAQVQAAIATLGNDPEAATAHERARLAGGALTWNLAQDYPARLWDARKALKGTDEALSEAQQRDTALAAAQRDEPARLKAFGLRIDELHRRIRTLIPQVAALGREQQAQVQELAVAELTRQKERLAVYTTQARFAVAQLFDRAKLAQDSGGDRVGK
jgi:hypothetical protein